MTDPSRRRHLTVVRSAPTGPSGPSGPSVEARPRGLRAVRALPYVDEIGLLVVAGALTALAVVLGLRSGGPPQVAPGPTAPTTSPVPRAGTTPAGTVRTPG